MKKWYLLVPIFLVFALGSVNNFGQVTEAKASPPASAAVLPPNDLPLSLPIGSAERYRNHMVSATNGLPGQKFVYNVQYTNIAGVFVETDLRNYAAGFSSFSEYVDSLAQFASKVQTNTVLAESYKPGTAVNFNAFVSCDLFVTRVQGFRFPSLEDITPGSVVVCEPFFVAENVMIPVPKLRKLEIEVSLPEGLVRYSWQGSTVARSALWPDSVDHATKGYLMLRPWYCAGQYQTKIRITTMAGNTACYNEQGNQIPDLPTIRIERGQIMVGGSPGRTVTVYGSDNCRDWTIFGSVICDNSQPVAVPLDMASGSQFYRAVYEK